MIHLIYLLVLVMMIGTGEATLSCPAGYVARSYQNIAFGYFQVRCCLGGYVNPPPDILCNGSTGFSVSCFNVFNLEQTPTPTCDCASNCAGTVYQNNTCSGLCTCSGICCSEGAVCNTTGPTPSPTTSPTKAPTSAPSTAQTQAPTGRRRNPWRKVSG